jgi:hypothetical protein
MNSVIDYAYFKKLENCENYSEKHKQILFFLIAEKKYFQKDELLCVTNQNEKALEDILIELENVGIITVEGWLVRLKPLEEFQELFVK